MSSTVVAGLALVGVTIVIAFLKMIFRRSASSHADSVSDTVLNRIRIEYPS